MERFSPQNVDEYINSFSSPNREKLEQLRKLIKFLLPEAIETISYQIPAYKINKNVIFFAGFKKHVSIYPAPRGVNGFEELDQFKGGKGTVQFPLDIPLPENLISKIVAYRKEEDSKIKK